MVKGTDECSVEDAYQAQVRGLFYDLLVGITAHDNKKKGERVLTREEVEAKFRQGLALAQEAKTIAIRIVREMQRT